MQTITIPEWLFSGLQFIGHNWVAFLAVTAVAVLSGVVTEVLKRKWIKPLTFAKFDLNEAEAKVKSRVAWVLTLVSAGFTTLGYVIFFLQANQSVVQQSPQIAQATVEVLGVAYSLYNLRLNKTYKNFADKLGTWSKSKPDANGTVSAPVNAPVQDDLV